MFHLLKLVDKFMSIIFSIVHIQPWIHNPIYQQLLFLLFFIPFFPLRGQLGLDAL